MSYFLLLFISNLSHLITLDLKGRLRKLLAIEAELAKGVPGFVPSPIKLPEPATELYPLRTSGTISLTDAPPTLLPPPLHIPVTLHATSPLHAAVSAYDDSASSPKGTTLPTIGTMNQ